MCIIEMNKYSSAVVIEIHISTRCETLVYICYELFLGFFHVWHLWNHHYHRIDKQIVVNIKLRTRGLYYSNEHLPFKICLTNTGFHYLIIVIDIFN